MIWYSESAAARIARLEKWHRWFAWYPVRIGEQRVWLEWVDRRLRMVFEGWDCDYRWPE
jgi:hypothetical protein